MNYSLPVSLTHLPFQQAALDPPQTRRKQAWTTGKPTNTLAP
jgi:hypothetical protein